LAKTVKSLKLRERPYADWDHMEPRDVGKVTELLSTYLQR
jgi:hypothetical protein